MSVNIQQESTFVRRDKKSKCAIACSQKVKTVKVRTERVIFKFSVHRKKSVHSSQFRVGVSAGEVKKFT